MSGTAMKMNSRTTNLNASDCDSSRRLTDISPAFADVVVPAIPEAGVVLDVGERVVHRPELLADALDEGAHVRPVALFARTRDEILAVDEIVDLAVADILSRPRDEIAEHPELRQAEVDLPLLPEGAVGVLAQFQMAAPDIPVAPGLAHRHLGLGAGEN